LPGTFPSPVIPGVAPEQNLAPDQEVRHEVNIYTYLHLTLLYFSS
jgi:hypothetical protein